MSAEHIKALEANTKAIKNLIAVWQSLHDHAKKIEQDPKVTEVVAAGVPVAAATEHQAAAQPYRGL